MDKKGDAGVVFVRWLIVLIVFAVIASVVLAIFDRPRGFCQADQMNSLCRNPDYPAGNNDGDSNGCN